jgi:nitrate/nitrite transporter NarK
VWFYLDDRIQSARWLDAREKAFLEKNLVENVPTVEHTSLGAILADRRVWLLGLTYFSCAMGQYGLTFWMPTLIQSAGVRSLLAIGVLTAIPYASGAVAMILFGQSADRHRERRWHMALPLFLGATALALSTITGTHTLVAMIALTVAAVGILPAAALFWNLPRAFLTGERAAAGIAAINSVANLGGFASPYIVGALRDWTHSTAAGLVAISAVLVAGGLATLRIPARLVNQ